MNSHPAIRTHLYDGWVLRFADGYTKRANSVNPLYYSILPIGEKISFCEEIYANQCLPTVFKLTPASIKDLDIILETNGYKKVTPTSIMVKALPLSNRVTTKTIINQQLSKAWQDNYFSLSGIIDSRKIQAATLIQSNIQNKILCGMLEDNGKVVACGLCVVERGYAGLYDIIVDSSYRNSGYGYDICTSLLNAATHLGAKTAYLQVIDDNTAAIALYLKLGFKNLYGYWYRIKNG